MSEIWAKGEWVSCFCRFQAWRKRGREWANLSRVFPQGEADFLRLIRGARWPSDAAAQQNAPFLGEGWGKQEKNFLHREKVFCMGTALRQCWAYRAAVSLQCDAWPANRRGGSPRRRSRTRWGRRENAPRGRAGVSHNREQGNYGECNRGRHDDRNGGRGGGADLGRAAPHIGLEGRFLGGGGCAAAGAVFHRRDRGGGGQGRPSLKHLVHVARASFRLPTCAMARTIAPATVSGVSSGVSPNDSTPMVLLPPKCLTEPRGFVGYTRVGSGSPAPCAGGPRCNGVARQGSVR